MQKEQEEYERLVGSKMIQDSKGGWICKDCNWKGQYRHKAKSHVRICCQRQSKRRNSVKERKFECSFEGCIEKYVSKKKLSAHYRLVCVVDENFPLNSKIGFLTNSYKF